MALQVYGYKALGKPRFIKSLLQVMGFEKYTISCRVLSPYKHHLPYHMRSNRICDEKRLRCIGRNGIARARLLHFIRGATVNKSLRVIFPAACGVSYMDERTHTQEP